MNIIKKSETTYEETIPEQVIPASKVEGTLDGVLADIIGTETALEKAKQEVIDITAQLATLNAKKNAVEGLGIVVQADGVVVEDPIEVIPE